MTSQTFSKKNIFLQIKNKKKYLILINDLIWNGMELLELSWYLITILA